ncbi:hypothetical protein [Ralstonia solanacearum]|uniref:hypothetical protein n=1 Tax=Ralstonia solanacearum TaxID=305 RepID=UPI00031F2DCE|nr:hypothetical protein [Ralstonia solanacearum]
MTAIRKASLLPSASRGNTPRDSAPDNIIASRPAHFGYRNFVSLMKKQSGDL